MTAPLHAIAKGGVNPRFESGWAHHFFWGMFMVDVSEQNTSLRQQFMAATDEIVTDFSYVADLILKVPYYLIRGAFLAARNQRSLME